MNREEVYSVWAPKNSIWSPWVVPVLFAQTDWENRGSPKGATPPDPPSELFSLDQVMNRTALILDLPGIESVKVGFALATTGFRLVPLYNASPAPEEALGLGVPSNVVVEMGPIIDAISSITALLKRLELPPEAPPVFLLDSLRLSEKIPAQKGMFDNRWMVFPQDFPSARFLKSHNINRAILLQKDRLEPKQDLAHILLRWQEGGITILSKKLEDSLQPLTIFVKRPSKYRAIWYRALVQLGFRQNSVGGFGSYIPGMTGAG